MINSNLVLLEQEVIQCRKCPRLVAWREQVAAEKRRAYQDQEYWGKPVPGFGDHHARIFVVGLAPGAHGSNRTGRQFTGDASGAFFYPALHRAGLANQPQSTDRNDGLLLKDVYTAPVCRCVPPQNKPNSEEMRTCQPYLGAELLIIQPRVIVALGRIAFESVLRIYSSGNAGWKFGHCAIFQLSGLPGQSQPAENGQGPWLLCSYHPSQQNTLTGKLTIAMFDQVWKTAVELAKKSS